MRPRPFSAILFLLITFTAFPSHAAVTEISAFGITIETVTPKLARQKHLAASSGVVVLDLTSGGPADIAGIKKGDIIVEIAGAPVGDATDAAKLAKRPPSSEALLLTLIRGDMEVTVGVKPATTDVLAEKPRDQVRRRGTNYYRKKPSPDASSGAQHSTVRVFYGTDRKSTGNQNPKLMFGPGRGGLTYGICDVTLPSTHKIGEMETPSWLRLEVTEDPAKHIILAAVKQQRAADFYRDVQDLFSAAGKKNAFIFVHGYNVSFEDAARRTAQLAYDLRFPGAPVFFSWPSQATYLGYPVDENNVEFARSDLRDFIRDFANTSKADSIYLIAHSMGNRALTGALGELYKSEPKVASQIKEVILAAPDIDSDVFKRDIVPALSGNGQSVTLYASSGDWALKASKKWHGYPRAGDSGDQIIVVPQLVTIDASGVETDLFGHGYFADSPSIVTDIGAIIGGINKPDLRTQLKRVDSEAGQHWLLSTTTP
jgi:esterase/lipase superfamily enzyme